MDDRTSNGEDAGGKADTRSGADNGGTNGHIGMEEALTRQPSEYYVLRLFVTGTTPKSARAISSIKTVCDEKLKGRYDLEVIDIYQQPELAKNEQIIAAPTLIKMLPAPLRKLIGNLSDTERVLVGLGLQPAVGPK